MYQGDGKEDYTVQVMTACTLSLTIKSIVTIAIIIVFYTYVTVVPSMYEQYTVNMTYQSVTNNALPWE